MPTTNPPLPRALAGVLLAATVLTGCSGGSAGETATSAKSAKAFNDADVSFASGMVQHHAQALQMVDLTLGRRLDPEVAELAEDIRAAQTPEIETMVDWLTGWEQPVPETVRDHANAHGDGHAATDMPGMLPPSRMRALERATGDRFQTLWLRGMIAHHQGAVTMAQDELEDGESEKAVRLARDIATAQRQEIRQMQELLER